MANIFTYTQISSGNMKNADEIMKMEIQQKLVDYWCRCCFVKEPSIHGYAKDGRPGPL